MLLRPRSAYSFMETPSRDTLTLIMTMQNLTVRLLQPEEFDRLEPLFAAEGQPVPMPEVSEVAVAQETDTGELLALFVLQPQYHGEPIWVHPDHRGNGLAGLVIQKINQLNVRYISFAPIDKPEVVQLCLDNGMEELPYRVFLKK